MSDEEAGAPPREHFLVIGGVRYRITKAVRQKSNKTGLRRIRIEAHEAPEEVTEPQTAAELPVWKDRPPRHLVSGAPFPPTGDVCTHCGGIRLIRSGRSCLTCLDCGASSGCG